MKSFFVSIDKNNLTIKLLILYILNLTDILFTQYLLFSASDLFVECNPVLLPIVTDIRGLLLKIFIPLIIIICWRIRINKSSKKQLKESNIGLLFIIGTFALINLLHVFNVALYIYMEFIF